MRAFVAGATGYTGRELVRQLAAAGHRVTAHVRPDSRSLATWRQRFADCGAETDTTPWTEAAMKEAFARLKPELVFAVLGTTRARARGEGMSAARAYDEIDYGLTALLIDAAREDPELQCFVYLSSIGVKADTGNPYLAARARAEARLHGAGLPFVIARPSFITGDRDERRPAEHGAAIVADASLSLARLLGARTLADRYRSMNAEELARALIAAALEPGCRNRVLMGEDLRALLAADSGARR